MQKVDYFTGETALEVVSPPVSEAEHAAQFGAYYYGGPPPTINVGNQGYNSPGFQGSPYGPGIGYNYGYYQQNPGYGYIPYGQNQGNPAFQFINPQQVAARDITVNIPPFNPWGSEYLPPINYDKRIADLEWRYMMDSETHAAEQAINQPQQFGYGFPNYYGGAYYSTPYNYNYFNGNKYIEELREMQDKARQDRIDFGIGLSKLAHNFLGEKYDEEEIRERYTGKTITVPGMTTIDLYDLNRFASLQPFDNSQMYRDHDAKVSAEFKKSIGSATDMNSVFENLALVDFNYRMEEELHRRRQDLKSSYDSNVYKTLIRQKVFDENIGKKTADAETRVKAMKDELLGSGLFPTLSQSANLADDGTLNITYSYDGNQVNNLNESQYMQERARFNGFLNSIHGSLAAGGG